jgi:hypothetical protein
MAKALDLRGQVFDRLTALHREENDSRGRARWLCRCSCGGSTTAIAADLRNGNTRSCGCLQAERRAERVKANTTHGGARTRIYGIWCGIKARCYNPKSAVWRYYGGKGISLCDEWHSFDAFRDWSFANGYRDDLTIDRIHNDGHYEPGNCRWVTQATQKGNQTSNRMVEYMGENIHLKEACRRAGLPYKTVHRRIVKLGWEDAKALSTPVRRVA